jgi:sulfur-oxidizing protein SoxB
VNRRSFLQALAAASVAGVPLSSALASDADVYDLPRVGNASLLHITDTHAQLLPLHFREPSVNLGVGDARGRPPHVVGEALLRAFGIAPGTRDAHALTYLDFNAAAKRFGTMGGFAHLATLVARLKASRPGALLLDGGDTWQGSATSLWTRGQDMIDAQIRDVVALLVDPASPVNR